MLAVMREERLPQGALGGAAGIRLRLGRAVAHELRRFSFVLYNRNLRNFGGRRPLHRDQKPRRAVGGRIVNIQHHLRIDGTGIIILIIQ